MLGSRGAGAAGPGNGGRARRRLPIPQRLGSLSARPLEQQRAAGTARVRQDGAARGKQRPARALGQSGTGLPKEVVESPPQEVLKERADPALGAVVWVTRGCSPKGWARCHRLGWFCNSAFPVGL